ncbi:MAG: PEP-CTERM sorting domain-containing protein, partial [Planctomycetales bacterium]|nr:PEP-CTERM sorting domain-containing protein [Planctomycetales bacterium]
MRSAWSCPACQRLTQSLRFATSAFAALAMIALASSSQATPIAINNYSFENANLNGGGWANNLDVPDDGSVVDPEWWVNTETNNGGNSFVEVIDGFSADGRHHLGMAANQNVIQTLTGVTLQPNMVYTLTVATGNRSGFTDVNNETIFGLNAGGTDLGRTTFNASNIAAGTFADQTFTYFSGASPPSGDLEIVLGNGAANRSHYDNIRLDVSSISTLPFRVVINRDTGNITALNQSGAPVNVAGLSLLSAAGTLSPANWQSVSGNYDSTGNGAVSSDPWLVFSSDSTDLSEGSLGTGSVANGGSINFGNGVWQQFPDEDVLFEYFNADTGKTVAGLVAYEGNGGNAFEFGDVNFDGAINALDWPVIRDNFNSDLTSGTIAEAYGQGDMNGDLLIDRQDVFAFKALFEAANPGVAFSTAIPEPATAALLALTLGAACSVRRRAPRVLVLVVAAVALISAPATTYATLIPINNFSFEDAVLQADGGQTWSNAIDVDTTDAVPPVDPDYWVDTPLNDGNAFSEYIANFSSEGINHLGIVAGATVTQTLTGVTLQPNSLYTLTVGVGNRAGTTGTGNQSTFGLDAGATQLGRATFNASTIPGGTFADASFSFATDASPATGDILISLGSTSGDRAHYDNIRLDRTDVDKANILTLTIGSGGAVLSNNSVEGVSHDIDYYEIASASGGISPAGWSSLQDADYEGNGAPGNGNGWEELGNADGNILGEFFLTGSSNFAPGASANLGSIYGGAQDLQLTYRTSDGSLHTGLVLYDLSSPFSADLDVDGDVDGKDFLLGQQQGKGNAYFADWASQFGSSAGGVATAAVPEPASGLLAVMAASLLGLGRRRNVEGRRSAVPALCALMAAVVGMGVVSEAQ